MRSLEDFVANDSTSPRHGAPLPFSRITHLTLHICHLGVVARAQSAPCMISTATVCADRGSSMVDVPIRCGPAPCPAPPTSSATETTMTCCCWSIEEAPPPEAERPVKLLRLSGRPLCGRRPDVGREDDGERGGDMPQPPPPMLPREGGGTCGGGPSMWGGSCKSTIGGLLRPELLPSLGREASPVVNDGASDDDDGPAAAAGASLSVDGACEERERRGEADVVELPAMESSGRPLLSDERAEA